MRFVRIICFVGCGGKQFCMKIELHGKECGELISILYTHTFCILIEVCWGPVNDVGWQVAIGKWTVVGEQRTVAECRWPADGGRWPMANGQWPASGDLWLFASSSLSCSSSSISSSASSERNKGVW